MKTLYTNRTLAELYGNKLNELGWKITSNPQQANTVSLKTRGMFKKLTEFGHCSTVWGIPNSFHLVAKQNMWLYIYKYYGLRRAKYITPRTYILKNADDLKSIEEALANGETLILKTNKQRRQGIEIIERLDQLTEKRSNEHVVAQQLKINTLGFEQRKFHLRYYLAFTVDKGKLRAFIHPKSRVVFACKNSKSKHEKYITHNDYYEAHLPLFGFDLVGRKVLNLQTFTRVQKLLRIALKPFEKILTSHLSNETQYFDLFGADIIFLENQYPLLIEINRSPSMKPINKKDEILKKEIVSSFLNSLNENKFDFKGWQQFF
ncbi:MAG: hypothetical protein JXQ87_16655 [Bacteroidia bacterium]